MKLSLIAAMARNRVIGLKNQLPWRISEDLKYFRRVTSGHPIIMGRKTFESIGKPLPGRLNIVISRNRELLISGAAVVNTLSEAILLANTEPTENFAGEIFVIGGAEIYRLALPRADRLYITEIDHVYPGDAYFPEWEQARFKEIKRERFAQDGDIPSFSFVVLERV